MAVLYGESLEGSVQSLDAKPGAKKQQQLVLLIKTELVPNALPQGGMIRRSPPVSFYSRRQNPVALRGQTVVLLVLLQLVIIQKQDQRAILSSNIALKTQ